MQAKTTYKDLYSQPCTMKTGGVSAKKNNIRKNHKAKPIIYASSIRSSYCRNFA